MGDAYPELEARREHILRATRQEEEKFLVTIEGGMARFDAVAPHPGQSAPEGGNERSESSPESTGVISGEEAFRLYDTFGFPLDLTQIMARERGFEVDEVGFEEALEEQRSRSRADRADSGIGRSGGAEPRLEDWQAPGGTPTQSWVGWDSIEVETEVVAWTQTEGAVGLILASNPFYLRAGGQVSDIGVVEGEDWSLAVEDVQAVEGRTAVFGPVRGAFPVDSPEPLPVSAVVDRRVRLDTERNHTATHVLHAVLREVLGEHVMQRGSLVDPDRLRFDFSHPEPLSGSQLRMIEEKVNRVIWDDVPVRWRIVPRDEAMASGAMALFGEKYGDEVRMVEIPGVSLELCGGTHLHHTGSIGPFRIVKEGGVASGVRRLEAVTGPRADDRFREAEEQLAELSRKLRTNQETLPRRIEELLHEKDELETLLAEARKGGGTPETVVHEEEVVFEGDGRARYRGLRLRVRDADDARSFGDAFREQETFSVAVVATEAADGRQGVFVFVTDDLVSKGVRAGDIVKEVAGMVGGRGGGRPHMAQGGVEDSARLDEALRHGATMVRTALAKAAT
jgi:alanyl-tRNA synthetase